MANYLLELGCEEIPARFAPNLLNDLVIIESQIEDLSQNIDNLTNLSSIATDINQNLDFTNQQQSKNIIVDYKEYYDRAIELYMNKD